MQPRALLSDSDGHAPLSSLGTPVFTALQHLHGASGQVKGLSANYPGGGGRSFSKVMSVGQQRSGSRVRLLTARLQPQLYKEIRAHWVANYGTQQ